MYVLSGMKPIRNSADTPQKYGRPNEATPAKWNTEYTDFNAPLENGTAPSQRQTENGAAVSIAPTAEEPAEAGAIEKAAGKSQASKQKEEEGESKKRKRHEGETPEEKAERKRKKKDNKEKRKSKGKVESDDGSD